MFVTFFSSLRCVLNIQCELFEHAATRQGSCTLISRNGGDTFMSTDHNLIYDMGEFCAEVIIENTRKSLSSFDSSSYVQNFVNYQCMVKTHF